MTKEYYKRGYERGKFVDLIKKDVTNNCSSFDIIFTSNGNDLWVQGCGYVMLNGIWAEIIKEETLEELSTRFEKYYRINRYSSGKALYYFFNKNKEIINRLSK